MPTLSSKALIIDSEFILIKNQMQFIQKQDFLIEMLVESFDYID